MPPRTNRGPKCWTSRDGEGRAGAGLPVAPVARSTIYLHRCLLPCLCLRRTRFAACAGLQCFQSHVAVDACPDALNA